MTDTSNTPIFRTELEWSVFIATIAAKAPAGGPVDDILAMLGSLIEELTTARNLTDEQQALICAWGAAMCRVNLRTPEGAPARQHAASPRYQH